LAMRPHARGVATGIARHRQIETCDAVRCGAMRYARKVLPPASPGIAKVLPPASPK
jgi:hypothetical protein